MIRYFRKPFWVYWSGWLISIVLSTFLFFPMKWVFPNGGYFYTIGLWVFKRSAKTESIVPWITCIVLLGILVTAFAFWLARRMYIQYVDILNEECNPQKFLQRWEPLLKKGRKNSPAKMAIVTTYAVGLHAAGHTADAIRLTEDLLVFPFKKRFAINKTVLYLNLCTYYARDAYDLAKAKEMLQCGKDILLQNQTAPTYSNYRTHLHNAENVIAFYEGEYTATLNYYTTSLSLAKTAYEKVSTHYTLSRIYEKLENIEKQKEHLEFVTQHGNTLQIVCEARDKLSALSI